MDNNNVRRPDASGSDAATELSRSWQHSSHLVNENKPSHIAIIPDGNRRWGELHGISRQDAYAIGIRKIGDVAKWCRNNGIRMLTMWGFSSENFERDSGEIEGLFELFKKNLMEILTTGGKEKQQIRVRFLGRIEKFPKAVQELMKTVEQETAKNSEYQLNLLLSYGGRDEIIDAVREMIKSGKRAEEIDEETISENIYTHGLPDPDLVIRTSGEQRLSGLMPWQTVYSELYFCKKLWPDFSKEDFLEALSDYSKRRRRFGK